MEARQFIDKLLKDRNEDYLKFIVVKTGIETKLETEKVKKVRPTEFKKKVSEEFESQIAQSTLIDTKMKLYLFHKIESPKYTIV